MILPPPSSPLFPYTTLFRSSCPLFVFLGMFSGARSAPRVKVWRARDALEKVWGSLRSEEHTSELQSPCNLVCRLLLEKKNKSINYIIVYIHILNKLLSEMYL